MPQYLEPWRTEEKMPPASTTDPMLCIEERGSESPVCRLKTAVLWLRNYKQRGSAC